jgi:hypothetical protein
LGTGSSRGLFGRAFATRGGSSDANGSGAPSGRLLLGLAIACLAVLALAPIAQAGKVPGFGVLGTGTLGAGTGQGGANPKGLYVNPTGAGGVPVGSVYFSDSTNNRVSQFTGAGAFIRTWGWDVVATGEHNTGANEQQNVTVKATGGNFTLTVTTANGSGSVTSGSNQVTNVQTSLGAFHVGDTITGAGIQGTTTITAVGASTLTLSKTATANNLSVSNLVATEITASIPATATAGQVQAALEAKEGVGAGNVTVTGGPGNATGSTPYQVTFTSGPLSHNDIVQMTAASVGLTGGSPSSSVAVTTASAGGGYEICQAVSTPTDVCKIGVAGAQASAFAGIQGLAVDPATGNVFVVSDTNKRVDVFSSTGQFYGAFGWNVNATTPEEKLQFCTAVTGCKAGSSGAGAGQFASMIGEAQQGSGPAVSPLNGHLLVPQPANRRVDEYSFTLSGSEVTGVAFVKGFGGDVTPTVNEKQTVTLTGATGGTFALSFGGKSTDVTGAGDSEAGVNEIANFKAADGAFVAGEEIFGPGIPAGTRITATTFDSLTLTNPVSATATGATFTAALPFNAAAAAVQAALAGLSSVGAGNAAVTGAPGGPYTVEFKGSLAGTDVAQMTGNEAKLTGTTPSVAVATTQTGANGTSTGFETCTVATTCKGGAGEISPPPPGTFFINTPTSVAVDSTGSIYVTGHSLTGNQVGNVQKFNSSVSTVELFAPSLLNGGGLSSTPRFVSIDPSNDRVLVVKKVSDATFKIFEFTRTGSFIDASPAGELGLFANGTITNNNGPQGFAVGTSDRAYYAVQNALAGAPPARILSSPPAPKATIESPSGVTQTTATFAGVAQPSAPGIEGGFATVAWFEYSSDNVSWTATDPVDIGNGSGAGNPNSCPTGNPPSCNLSQVVGGLKGGTTYLVRLVVSNGTKTTSTTANFTTVDAAPGITGLAATEVTKTSASLNGEIEPNGKVTSYHFEWGPTTAYGTRVPADLEAIAGGGNQPIPVSIQISGLQPGATYHYRIVAKSVSGTTTSADQEVTALNDFGLPSNRGFELVTPANKRPVGDVQTLFNNQAHFRAAEEGGAFAYSILNGLADSASGGEMTFAGERTGSGWTVGQITPPALIPAPVSDTLLGRPGVVRAINSNVRCAAVETHNPLTADTPQADVENGVQNLYLWHAGGTHSLLTTPPPLNPTSSDQSLAGLYYQVAGITPDCSRAFFRSLTYNFLPGASGIYEWDNGVLRDAGLRPDGSTLPGSVGLGVGRERNTVSNNGRLFFTATSNEAADNGKTAVFVRKGPGQVVNASKPTSGNPTQGAAYQLASSDGSHVFFIANYGIASTSSSGPTTDNCAFSIGNPFEGGNLACDLYDYDVEAGTLTDVSANTSPANSKGAVALGVVDVSDDGEVVYFAARGQLVPGEGRTYKQNLTQGSGYASIYRYEDGNISYVGGIAMTDVGGSLSNQRVLARNEAAWAAQTTKDGDYLLFPSTDDMTGTNPSNRPQPYLYSSETGTTECVSCPKGRAVEENAVIPNQGENGESSGFSGTYTPRSLSEDGRVFFMSDDVLAPGAVPGEPPNGIGALPLTNTYEWYRGQISLLTSGRMKLIDIGGDDGRDVYVRTYSQLIPEDIDFAADVYDMRLGSPGFAPPPAVTPCDPAADQCQGTPSTPPSAPGSPSSDFNGPGNPAPEKAKPPKCGKGKVLKHGKCVQKQGKKKKQKGKAQSKRAASTNRGGAK